MTPYYESDGIQLFLGDSREHLVWHGAAVLRHDVIITDPPYDARTHAGQRSEGRNESLIDFDPLDIANVLPLLLGAAKRWVIAFCTMEMIGEYQRIAGDSWVRAGFWRRPDAAPQFTGDRPATPGDAIAIMHGPGKKRWNGGGHHAYWEYGVERKERVHPAQKPLPLMLDLVGDFSENGDVILDPFAGSGTTLVAAKALGRTAIGFEIEERYCEIAARRLENQARQQTLEWKPKQEAMFA